MKPEDWDQLARFPAWPRTLASLRKNGIAPDLFLKGRPSNMIRTIAPGDWKELAAFPAVQIQSNRFPAPFLAPPRYRLRFAKTPDLFLKGRPSNMIRTIAPEDWKQLAAFPAALQFQSNEFLVAIVDGALAAVLAWRRVAPDEIEILHIETLASFRNNGIARRLLKSLKQQPGDLFLEVRPSNLPARHLYETEGFTRVGLRKDYYSQPSEEAIVLKFHSC